MDRSPRPLPRCAWVTFATVAAFSLGMIWRNQVGGDAVRRFSAGAGGYEPGAMTSLLVAVLLMLAFHLASWLLLDRVMREAVSARERLVFFLLYGLTPWRMFFSGFLWNPNYLYLAGAVHLWACWRQRQRPSYWPQGAWWWPSRWCRGQRRSRPLVLV